MKTGLSGLRNSLLLRLMLPAFLLLCCFIPIGGFLYSKTLSVMETEVVNANLNLLEQAKNTLDYQLGELKSNIQQTTDNPTLDYLMHMENLTEGSATFSVLEARESLSHFGLHNPFVLNAYIMFKKSEMVLNHKITATYKDFYDYYFYYEDVGFDEWKYWLDISNRYYYEDYIPVKPIVMDGKRYSAITYVTSIGHLNSYRGLVVILLDYEEVNKVLSVIETKAGGWSYIADQDQKILAYTGDQPPTLLTFDNAKGVLELELDGTHMLVTYVQSDFNGWTYVAAQPYAVVMEKVNYFNQTWLAMFFIFLALGLILSLALTYRNTKPLQGLVATVEEHRYVGGRREGNIFDTIQQAVSNLVMDKEKLQQKLQEQQPLLKNVLLEKILHGESETEEQTHHILSQLGLQFNGTFYAVCLIHFSNPDTKQSVSLPKQTFRSLLCSVFGSQAHVHELGDSKKVLILQCEESSREACKTLWTNQLKRLSRKLYDECHVMTQIAVGGFYTNFHQIFHSFNEARKTMNDSEWNAAQALVFYSELPASNHYYQYNLESEQRLIRCVKSGSEGGARQILDEIYDVNFKERTLSSSMLKLLMTMLWGTVLKIQEEIDVDPGSSRYLLRVVEEVEDREGAEHAFRKLDAHLIRLSQLYYQRKQFRNDRFIKSIKSFIQENYANPELSLTLLADHFGVSEAHMSRQFKEQTGSNFFEYLEQIRMKHAEQLLLHTSKTIKEISALTGYNSSNTFGRAFKRLHGVSAASYRHLNSPHSFDHTSIRKNTEI